RVRVEIRSRTDWVNHCPCFRARRDGIICAHALAAGLETIEPTQPKAESPASGAAPATTKTAAPAGPPARAAKTPLHPASPLCAEEADETAHPAQLHLVRAPNLAAAWEKGRLTLGVEVSLERGRSLLKALPPACPLFLEAGDVALFRVLQELSPSEVPRVHLLGAEHASRLFATIPGHPRISLGKKAPLQISPLPYRPV